MNTDLFISEFDKDRIESFLEIDSQTFIHDPYEINIVLQMADEDVSIRDQLELKLVADIQNGRVDQVIQYWLKPLSEVEEVDFVDDIIIHVNQALLEIDDQIVYGDIEAKRAFMDQYLFPILGCEIPDATINACEMMDLKLLTSSLSDLLETKQYDQALKKYIKPLATNTSNHLHDVNEIANSAQAEVYGKLVMEIKEEQNVPLIAAYRSALLVVQKAVQMPGLQDSIKEREVLDQLIKPIILSANSVLIKNALLFMPSKLVNMELKRLVKSKDPSEFDEGLALISNLLQAEFNQSRLISFFDDPNIKDLIKIMNKPKYLKFYQSSNRSELETDKITINAPQLEVSQQPQGQLNLLKKPIKKRLPRLGRSTFVLDSAKVRPKPSKAPKRF